MRRRDWINHSRRPQLGSLTRYHLADLRRNIECSNLHYCTQVIVRITCDLIYEAATHLEPWRVSTPM